MQKWMFALMAFLVLVVSGCASKPVVGTGTPIDIGDGAALEEIAAYDDEAVELLPDMVSAEL